MTSNLEGSAQISFRRHFGGKAGRRSHGFLIKDVKPVVSLCLCFFAGKARRRLCVHRNVASHGIFKS